MGVHTLRHHGVLSFVTEHPRYVYGGSFFFVVIPCLLDVYGKRKTAPTFPVESTRLLADSLSQNPA
jgi:hypothetical protein